MSKLTIVEFVAARLDDEKEGIDRVRTDIESNPPYGASFAVGAVRQHDLMRESVNEAIAADRGEEENLGNASLRYAATHFSTHVDFNSEWDFRHWARAHFS